MSNKTHSWRGLIATVVILGGAATGAVLGALNRDDVPNEQELPPVNADRVAQLRPGTDKVQLPGQEAAEAPLPPSTDHTTFGGTVDRNMINLKDQAILNNPDPNSESVLRWKADLGSRAYGGPIIAAGKIYVGTNNERPRNERDSRKNSEGDVEPIDKGILMCFDEKTGEIQWQAVHDKLPSGQLNDWPKEGVCSTATAEGKYLYYTTNRCTLICVDTEGFANGNQGFQDEQYKAKNDADIIWELDMIKELNVFPHNMTASSPLIVGDTIFLTTANGVDENHINIPAPRAPSFLAVSKKDGKVLWQSNEPGTNIMHGQWANPCFSDVGVPQVIFPGGDGWLYAFTPDKGELIWKFDANPKEAEYDLGGAGTKSDFIGTPVVYNGQLYIGTGQDPEHFSGVAYFYCIDLKKAVENGQKSESKEVSAFVVDKSEKQPDGKFKYTGKPNPLSAQTWVYGGQDTRKYVPRDFTFGRTMSTACIVDDIIYISELQGYIHCLDAKTGKKFWQYDTKGAIWGSPYYVDGKVFLATESGDLFVFKHSKEPKLIDEIDNPEVENQKDFNKALKAKRKLVEAEYLINKYEFDAPVRSTPVVANGILYVMTERTLFAFSNPK